MKKVPVFLHYPKCAGTTIYYRFIEIHKNLEGPSVLEDPEKQKTRVRLFNENKEIVASIFIEFNSLKNAIKFRSLLDPNNENLSTLFLPYELFCKLSKAFTVKYVIINAAGFQYIRSGFFEKIFQVYDIDPIYFMFVRDPLEREYSFFEYIKSDRSKNELTHNRLKSNSFKEYITDEASDSWLISSYFSVLPELISQTHYDELIEFLIKNKVFISESKNADQLFNHILKICDLDTNLYTTKGRNLNPASSEFPNVKESLGKEVISYFFKIKKWEYKLFEQIIPKNQNFHTLH